jgi:MYXO-CTERM domain-containing protein
MRVLVTLIVGMIGSSAQAASWYVDQAAAAGGDGSQAKPFRTIAAAKGGLKTGDTIWISNGVYAETVDFWHVAAGTAGRTTVRAVAGHAPIIDGGGTSNFVIQAGETHSMTFQGLTVRNATGTAFNFYKANDGQVIDCKTENVGAGISFYFANKGYVANSDIYGGINGKETDGTVLVGNKIHHSKAEGITLHADSKNCKYLSNIVYDNVSVNIYIDSASYMTVDGNLIYMTGTPASELAGIQLADESYPNVTSPKLTDITITNNIILNTYHGIVFWKGHFPGQSALKNVTIANNTIVNSKANGIVWDAGPHGGSSVRNNIFANQSGGVYLLLAKSTTGVAVDHNLWYAPGMSTPFNWGGGSAYDHAGWIAAAAGQGAGDVLGDPKLVGAWTSTAANFKLAAGSPAIDKGVAIAGLNHDFDNKLRPVGTAFDLGAFEFGSTVGVDGGPPPKPDQGTKKDSGGAKKDGGAPIADRSLGSERAAMGDGPGRDSAAGDGRATPSDGCGCRVGSSGASLTLALALLVILGFFIRARRRS